MLMRLHKGSVPLCYINALCHAWKTSAYITLWQRPLAKHTYQTHDQFKPVNFVHKLFEQRYEVFSFFLKMNRIFLHSVRFGVKQKKRKQNQILTTVNSRFKKDLKLQIHLHKGIFFGQYFLNQTTLDLRKEKWTFLNQEFTVSSFIKNK